MPGRQMAHQAPATQLSHLRQGAVSRMTQASAMPAIIKGAYGFDGEVVIVTGGARGIGEGIVEVLAAAGATVIVADINGEMAEERAGALRRAGHLADSVYIDIAEEAS